MWFFVIPLIMFCRFIDLQGSQTEHDILGDSISFVGLSIYKVLKHYAKLKGKIIGFVGLSIYKVLKPKLIILLL